jgi:hypothetical protein
MTQSSLIFNNKPIRLQVARVAQWCGEKRRFLPKEIYKSVAYLP